MSIMLRTAGAIAPLVFVSTLFAQTATLPAPATAPAPAIAATVDGQPIYEAAVQRALQSVPPDEHAKARPEIVDFLVGNTIVDRYLAALKITVEQKDVDEHLERFRADVKQHNRDYALMLKQMKMTEAELKEQIYNQLRWEKFVAQQATDDKLKGLFNYTPEGFDGTAIRARHILLPIGADAKSKEETAAKLRAIKAQIEKNLATELAKLPPDADNVMREKKKRDVLDKAFSDAATQFSTCPSKAMGGDIGWFPRYGSMAESFAKAGFALKLHEISEVVATAFGYHLILVIERKPGTPVKFEDPKVKDMVKEVYAEKLKDAVVEQMKPRVKVEIMPVR